MRLRTAPPALAALVILGCTQPVADRDAPDAETLAAERLTDCLWALENVSYQHRSWPRENGVPKPPLEAVLQREALRDRARDTLRRAAALSGLYNRTITGEQVQDELDRMARNSQNPAELGELFSALGNDANKAATCLAWPQLVEQQLRYFYLRDRRLHEEARTRAEAALFQLAANGTPQSAGTHQMTFRRVGTVIVQPEQSDPSVVELSPIAFSAVFGRLRAAFTGTGAEHEARWMPDALEGVGSNAVFLHIGQVSSLLEDAERFYALVVRENIVLSEVKLDFVELQRKTPFEEWWSTVRDQWSSRTGPPAYPYTLPPVAEGSCPDGSWRSAQGPLQSKIGITPVWTGNEMIVWGSLYPVSMNSYADGARYNPATDTWTPISNVNAPLARNGQTTVWTGSKMIVWGGRVPYNQSSTDSNTGAMYDPATDTWEPTSTIDAPDPREQHTAVWTGSEMIIWGGSSCSDPPNCVSFAPTNDGGAYDPVSDSWRSLSAKDAPAARAKASAVWSGSEMIIWGGRTNSGLTNTGGRYDPALDQWQPINSDDAPAGRDSQTALWTGTEMMVWGGCTARSGPNTACNAMTNTGARYDPDADQWQPTDVEQAPDARAQHSAVWTGTKMIIWGGLGPTSLLNSGAIYDPETNIWMPTTFDNAPGARNLHSAVWTGTEMIVWSGCAVNANDRCLLGSNTGFRYRPDEDTWTPIRPTADSSIPYGAAAHTAAWTGNEMIVWGGCPDSSNCLAAVSSGSRYQPATDSWTPITNLDAPSARGGHAAVWTGTEMIIWGSGLGAVSGGRYNPLTDQWLPAATVNAPISRYSPSAVWTGTEMIIWGGKACATPVCSQAHVTNTGARYNPSTDEWGWISTVDAPRGRLNHSATWIGTRMMIWGGNLEPSSGTNTGGLYDPITNTWSSTSTVDAPYNRFGNTAVWTGEELLVWLGDPGTGSHGARYQPATDSWLAMAENGAPPSAYGHTSVWTGREMLVWGGLVCVDNVCGINTLTNAGGRYDPGSDAWSIMTLDGAPSPRVQHTAVWADGEMIIWGGGNGLGASYCVSP